MLLIHGSHDRNVPLYHPQLLQERMQSLGLEAELVVLPEVGHDVSQAMRQVNRRLFEHFARTLGAPPPSNPQAGGS